MPQAVRRFWPVVVVGIFVTVFGGYVLYEKVMLSLVNGCSHERAGLICRADDPFSFWLGLGVYGVCAGAVFLGGVALVIWGVRKRRS